MRHLALAISLACLALPSAVQAEDMPMPKVSADFAALPQPVQDKRNLLLEAAKGGDIEALRAIIKQQMNAPVVSYGRPDDAVDYLTTSSADGAGLTALATLREMLLMPYAVIGEPGEENYVWPYLSQLPDLAALTAAQKVDAFSLTTPEALDQMIEFGGWYDWRVFIQANGEWSAFVAGD